MALCELGALLLHQRNVSGKTKKQLSQEVPDELLEVSLTLLFFTSLPYCKHKIEEGKHTIHETSEILASLFFFLVKDLLTT